MKSKTESSEERSTKYAVIDGRTGKQIGKLLVRYSSAIKKVGRLNRLHGRGTGFDSFHTRGIAKFQMEKIA